MTSPSSSTQKTIVSDSAGDQAALTLQPTGLSSISVTTAGGGPTAAITVSASGAAEIGASASSNSATIIANAASAICTVDAINSLNVESKLTVQPGFLAAGTNGGGTSETSVQHQVGFVNTVTLNGSPNAGFTDQSNNRVAYFSGISQMVDNNSGEASGIFNCEVPIPLPSGDTVCAVRLEIVLLVKCIISSPLIDSGVVGDYFLQKLYTTWVNNNGTIEVANGNTSGSSPISSFTGVAILDTSGSTIQSQGIPHRAYKLGVDTVVTPGSGANLLVQGTPTVNSDLGVPLPVGTCVVQYFVTATYN
jgi:hypothetical protein